MAFLVADPWHGHGLGSLLLEHLAAAAGTTASAGSPPRSCPTTTACSVSSATPGFSLTRSSSSGVTDVSMATTASAAAVAAADGRERAAEARSLSPSSTPRRVVVVGARRSGTGVGHAILSSIQAGGYTGELFAVHPHAATIDDVVRLLRGSSTCRATSTSSWSPCHRPGCSTWCATRPRAGAPRWSWCRPGSARSARRGPRSSGRSCSWPGPTTSGWSAPTASG